MLFCAGVGTGLMFWAPIEWAHYIDTAPLGVEAGSGAAAVSSMLANEGTPATIVAILDQLSFATLVIGVFALMALIFSATTYDSASLCHPETRSERRPSLLASHFLGLCIGCIAFNPDVYWWQIRSPGKLNPS